MLEDHQKELIDLCFSLEAQGYLKLDTVLSFESAKYFDILPNRVYYIKIGYRGVSLWDDISDTTPSRLSLEQFLEVIPLELKKIFLYNLDLFI